MTNIPILCSIGIFIKEIESSSLKMWVQPRLEKGVLNNKLEFPGGKIESEEKPINALIREIYEETNVDLKFNFDINKIQLFKIHPYTYNDRSIVLYTYKIFLGESDEHIIKKLDQKNGKWLSLVYEKASSSMVGIVPDANLEIIDELAAYIKENISEDKNIFKELIR